MLGVVIRTKVAEMRMSCWMYSVIKSDRIRIVFIREILEVLGMREGID